MERFGYACPQCSKGTVKKTDAKDYEARINNYVVIIPKAILGICDECHITTVDPTERRRWEWLFYKQLESRKYMLTSEQIAAIRARLGLSVFEFAILIGATPHNISMWENPVRRSLQPVMADILLRSIMESIKNGNLDILKFLETRTKEMNVPIKINLVKRKEEK